MTNREPPPHEEQGDSAPEELDLGTLALFVGFGMTGELQQSMIERGFDDVRVSYGYVFQQLVRSKPTISDLAGRLDITHQGASKIVVALERADYVHRVPDDEDARVRRVQLTDRGRGVIDAYLAARRDVEVRLAERHGPERIQAAREVLAEVLTDMGGADAVRRRDIRPPA